jgi:hypothetical protein
MLELDEDRELHLNFLGGDDCDPTSVAGSGKRMSTHVVFRCSTGGGASTGTTKKPTFLGLRDCVYTFEWNTTAACPLPKNLTDVASATFDESAKVMTR